MPEQTGVQVWAGSLKAFCVRVFEKLDVPEEDGRVAADVLVAADLRGVDSHGVARLRRYVDGLRNGMAIAHPQEMVVTETATTAVIDAGAGLGHPVSRRAMERPSRKQRSTDPALSRCAIPTTMALPATMR